MGLQGLIGDVTSTVGNNIKGFLETAWGAVNGIPDRIGTFVADVWDGGFAGVSDFEALKTAIKNYSDNVQKTVNEYNINTNLQSTFKGSAGEELKTFVVATKSLLDAYVKLVEKWNVELNEAYKNYKTGDATLKNNVSNDARDVNAAAKNINIG